MNPSNDKTNGSNARTTSGMAGAFGWTFANACILGMTAWIAFASGGSPFARSADAGSPPPPSSRTTSSAVDAMQALDSGTQRAEMVGELRAMRQELAEMRTLLGSGRIRAEIANVGELRGAIEAAAKGR